MLRCLAWPTSIAAVLVFIVLAAGSHAAYAQGGAPIVSPPSVTQTHTDVNVTVQAPPPDDAQISSAADKSSSSVVVNVMAPVPVAWAKGFDSMPNIWSQTPAPLTYGNGDLKGLVEQMNEAAKWLAVIALVIAGAKLALSQNASFGRVLTGVAFAASSLAFWQMGIDLNNALCAAINAPTLPEIVSPNLSLPSVQVGSIPSPDMVAKAVLVAVYAFIAFLTYFSLIARLAFIEVLIAIGPLALICFTAEESASWGSLYARLSVGMLFSQVLIVLGFRVARIVGGLGSGGVLGVMIGIAVLLLIREMPSLLSSGRMNRGPSNAAAAGMLFAIGRRAMGVFL